MAIKITNTSIYIDHLSVMLPANKIQTLEGEKNKKNKTKKSFCGPKSLISLSESPALL